MFFFDRSNSFANYLLSVLQMYFWKRSPCFNYTKEQVHFFPQGGQITSDFVLRPGSLFWLKTHEPRFRAKAVIYEKGLFRPLILKIGLDRASIVGKLKPTAAILEWPPEEYSGVTEKKMRTLTFSTSSWWTKCVDWILIKWQNFPLPLCDSTKISNMAAGGHSNMAAVGNNKSILWSPQNSLVIFTFKVA